MIRTITIGSCISVQGVFERQQANGNIIVRVGSQTYEGKPVVVTLPNTVDLEVTDAPPEIKGATATNQTKPATLETGLVVTVPPFVKVGELIRVDTRTGEYVTRVKE